MPSRRSHVRIHASADRVWSMVRDPLDWAWFPELGVMTMDGDRRHVTLPSGLPIVEQIVNVDDTLRRFQYVIVDNFVISDHLSTIDVIDLEDGTCLVTYSLEIKPDAMAIIIGYATRRAIHNLRDLAEGN
jgi:hypothetical protein